jgi:hypothetical protein
MAASGERKMKLISFLLGPMVEDNDGEGELREGATGEVTIGEIC